MGALEGCRQRRAGPDSPLEATAGRTVDGDEDGSRGTRGGDCMGPGAGVMFADQVRQREEGSG